MGIFQHKFLIDKNRQLWHRKPLLKAVYTDLYRTMVPHLSQVPGKTLELGAGMGTSSEIMPDCLRTDLFHYPWLDLLENAYCLSFHDGTISNLIMVDVFHHLRYPGTALKEFHRVLPRGGRIILMEPGFGLLGMLIYEWMHIEPVGKMKDISWFAPEGWSPTDMDYYAAQGNATRIFTKSIFADRLSQWKIVKTKQIVALAYAASGGYSGPQLYPTSTYRFVKFMEKFLQLFPTLFATRFLVVLEKK